jgi:CubicO group peptidase (beta-lactamase class C family)
MIRKLLIPVFLLVLGSLSAQSIYFPPVDDTQPWETLSPDSLNWCNEKIEDLYSFLDENNSKGFIILKNGKIVLEKYFDDFNEDSIWYYASAGKSVMATMLGIAQEQGLLSINDPVSEYLGQGWTDCTPQQEDSITIWHQITMTTGLDESTNPDNGNCLDPDCLTYLADPGTRWYYYNAPYRLTQDVLEAASGMNKNMFLRQNLTNTIGMRGFWLNYVLYGRTRDMARFGLLSLAKGNWDGNPVLNDPAYFEAMTTPSQNLNPAYGYLWWLNGSSFHLLPGLQFPFQGSIIPNAPDDMFAALGKNDQKIYVVPSQSLVVVRCGDSAGGVTPALSSFDNELWAKILDLECTSSLDQVTLSKDIEVFPNPSSDLFTITSPEPILKATILDAAGNAVWEKELEGQLNVRVQWPGGSISGVYFLQLNLPEGTVFKKIIRI